MLKFDILNHLINSNSTSYLERALCGMALGIKPEVRPYQRNLTELNSLLMMLDKIPQLRVYIPTYKLLDDSWEHFVDQFDEIEQSFLNEAGLNWTKRVTAPKTFKMM